MTMKEKVVAWSKMSNVEGWAPGARQGHCACVVNRQLYMFGGMEGAKRTNSTLAFDLTSRKWKRVKVSGRVPAPRCYAASWVSGSNFYIHGGEAEGHSPGLDHTRLDAHTGRPTDVSHDKSVTQSDVFAMVNDKVRVRRRCLDDMFCFDTAKGQWQLIKTTLAPLARKGHTITQTSSNGKPVLMMLGGAPSGSATLCPMIPYLLPSSDTELQSNLTLWSCPDVDGELPTARFGHSCTPVNSPEPHLVVFGGMTEDGDMLDDLQLLHCDSTRWVNVQPRGRPPSPRYGHTAGLVQGPSGAAGGGALMIYGGVSSSQGHHDFPVGLHLCNLSTFTWSEVGVSNSLYPPPRYGHIMVPLPAGSSNNTGSSGSSGSISSSNSSSSGSSSSSSRDQAMEFLVFGGLNSMYNSPDMWQLDSTFRPALDVGRNVEILDGQTEGAAATPAGDISGIASVGGDMGIGMGIGVGMDDSFMSTGTTASDLRPMSAASSASSMSMSMSGGVGTVTLTLQQQREVETHLMESRKDVIRIQRQLSNEISRRTQVERELAELKALYAQQGTELLASTRSRQQEAKVMQQALDNERRRSMRIDEERREAYALVTMADAAANLRLKAWQARTKEREEQKRQRKEKAKQARGRQGATCN